MRCGGRRVATGNFRDGTRIHMGGGGLFVPSRWRGTLERDGLGGCASHPNPWGHRPLAPYVLATDSPLAPRVDELATMREVFVGEPLRERAPPGAHRRPHPWGVNDSYDRAERGGHSYRWGVTRRAWPLRESANAARCLGGRRPIAEVPECAFGGVVRPDSYRTCLERGSSACHGLRDPPIVSTPRGQHYLRGCATTAVSSSGRRLGCENHSREIRNGDLATPFETSHPAERYAPVPHCLCVDGPSGQDRGGLMGGGSCFAADRGGGGPGAI